MVPENWIMELTQHYSNCISTVSYVTIIWIEERINIPTDCGLFNYLCHCAVNVAG